MPSECAKPEKRSNVVAFKTAFQNAFGDFDAYLKSALIDGITQLNAAGEEEP